MGPPMSCSTQTTDERGNGILHAKTLGLAESTSAIQELFLSTARELLEGSADDQASVAGFLQRNANAIFEVTLSSTFRRLRMINVLATKASSFVAGKHAFLVQLPGCSQQPEVRIQSRHTRDLHSLTVAAHALVFGVKAECSDGDLLRLVLAALCHDLGHPALGHDTDDLLVELGRKSHEARGVELILRDSQLGTIFRYCGIDPREIAEIVKEKSRIGRILSLADTLGYLRLDTRMMHIPLEEDFGSKAVSAFLGTTDDALIVSNARPLERVLAVRAAMYSQVYFQETALAVEAFFHQTAKVLIELGLLAYDEMENGVDASLLRRMTRQVEKGSFRVPVLNDLWKVVQDVRWLDRLWKSRVASEDSAYTSLDEGRIVVPRPDCAKKKLSVRLHHADGEQVTIHAAQPERALQNGDVAVYTRRK